VLLQHDKNSFSNQDLVVQETHTETTLLVQEISSVEENITKKKVGAAASKKQAEKLSKEVAKGEKETAKVTEDLDQKEKDLQVPGIRQDTQATPHYVELC
jgi:septal ring factor EnvC (AmiA/AmiB activator)